MDEVRTPLEPEMIHRLDELLPAPPPLTPQQERFLGKLWRELDRRYEEKKACHYQGLRARNGSTGR